MVTQSLTANLEAYYTFESHYSPLQIPRRLKFIFLHAPPKH